MTTFEYKGKTFYMDNRLMTQLDQKVVPDLKSKDKDVVFLIDGKERGGKSKMGDILAAFFASRLNTEYNLSNVCMTPEEFRNKVMSAKKNEPIIYDEAHRGMASSRSLSEINNLLKDLMMEMGQKNLVVIIILPTFFLLDKYAALFRARGLFHVYERRGQRGFWVYFNEKNKLKLYMKGKKEFNYDCIRWPPFRGRFYNQYAVDEVAYRAKKAKSFTDKPRITKAETYKAQRDTLFWILANKFNKTQLEISQICKEEGYKVERKTISDAILSIDKDKRQGSTIPDEESGSAGDSTPETA